METLYEQNAKVFKALCDEKRLRILELLRSGEKCACVLIEEMGMPQSSLSYHMKVLCESGIVEGREAGKWTHYRISRSGSDLVMELLTRIITPAEPPEAEKCRSAAGQDLTTNSIKGR
jgi:ArsR family transcriptional regulator